MLRGTHLQSQIPPQGDGGQGDQEFKAILGYTESSDRLGWSRIAIPIYLEPLSGPVEPNPFPLLTLVASWVEQISPRD